MMAAALAAALMVLNGIGGSTAPMKEPSTPTRRCPHARRRTEMRVIERDGWRFALIDHTTKRGMWHIYYAIDSSYKGFGVVWNTAVDFHFWSLELRISFLSNEQLDEIEFRHKEI